MNRNSYAKKDTFWNRVRAEKGIKIKEVAEFLHRPEGSVGMYFSGQVMPNENTIRTLCDFFDVEFDKGVLEFQHANRNWKAEHNAKLQYRSNTPVAIPEMTTHVEEILKTLYGVISCEDFVAIYNHLISGSATNFDVEELIYGKFDYATYCKIRDILRG